MTDKKSAAFIERLVKVARKLRIKPIRDEKTGQSYYVAYPHRNSMGSHARSMSQPTTEQEAFLNNLLSHVK